MLNINKRKELGNQLIREIKDRILIAEIELQIIKIKLETEQLQREWENIKNGGY